MYGDSSVRLRHLPIRVPASAPRLGQQRLGEYPRGPVVASRLETAGVTNRSQVQTQMWSAFLSPSHQRGTKPFDPTSETENFENEYDLGAQDS